jgi:xylulokinase
LGEDGRVVAAAHRPLQIRTGAGGIAEQSTRTWQEQAGACLREVAGECRPLAVAATGQMNGPVLLDAGLQPVGPVQMWCDTRCAAQCARIAAVIPPQELLRITGHTAVTGYTAPKLLWLAEHEPGVFGQAAHLLFPKDFLTWQLTGQFVSDYSDASNSLLLDIRAGAWAQPVVEALGLGSLRLPALYESAAVVGRITPAGAAWSGLPEGLPVAAGAGDSIASALGAGMLDASLMQIVIGTAGNVNCVFDQPVIDPGGRVHTGCFTDRRHWIISGVQQSAGSCLRWWSDITRMSEADLVAELPDEPAAEGAAVRTGDHPGFAPYLSGERTPHLDPHVRAAFVGLGRGSTRADMTRALLEGVAYSFRDAVEVLAELGVRPPQALVCGGGANSDRWCGIIAGALAMPLSRVTADTTARGAAMLAAVAAGRFASPAQVVAAWPVSHQPVPPGRCATAYHAYRDLYPRLRGIQS